MGFWSQAGSAIAGAADSIIGGAARLVGIDMMRSAENKQIDKSNRFTAAQADIDRALQREFAQNSLGWQIAQLRKEGISPLVALGNNPTYSNQFAAGAQPSGSSSQGLPDALGRMGQAIGNILKPQTRDQKRLAEIGIETENEKLRKIGLENQILGEELRVLKSRTPDVGPSNLTSQIVPGQNDLVDVNKAQQVAKSGAGFQAGSHAEYKVKEQPDGSFLASPADQQGIDEAPFFVLQRLYKRGVDYAQGMLVMVPWEKARQKGFQAARRYKPNFPPKPGHVWAYHPTFGDWKQVRIKYRKEVSTKAKRAARMAGRPDFGKNSRGVDYNYRHHRTDGRR